MLPLLALTAFQAQAPVANVDYATFDSLLGPDTLRIGVPVDRMDPPKLSPKSFGEPPAPWPFEWRAAGYVRFGVQYRARIELFSQESTQSASRPVSVARLLTRLCAFNMAKLKLDHSQEFGNGMVSVYLCYGGKAGGEQLLDVEHQKESDVKVNTIYLYDLASFTDPVEMVREVAHEYGHATLPPIGGYSAPEDWSNGLMGEKLYLAYLAEARRKGELTGADVLGASTEGLNAWTKLNVDPLVAQAAAFGPRPPLLAKKDKASMDEFLGLALLTSRLYGPGTLSRALLANGTDGVKFPSSAATAAEEGEKAVLDIPPALRTKPLWIPLGRGKVSGATTLAVRDGWARIKPGKGPVVVLGHPD